jgi:hypothetical protein
MGGRGDSGDDGAESAACASARAGGIGRSPTGEDQEPDITEAAAVMRKKTNAAQAGNLTGLEETLTAQTAALDARTWMLLEWLPR